MTRPGAPQADTDLARKQAEFNAAMARYESRPAYRWTGILVAGTNVGLQVVLGYWAFRQGATWLLHAITAASAFILADFINGIVHMVMDNHDDYTSPAGPLVAAFHLHHRRPRYTVRPVPLVYFQESGSKIWLAVLMLPLTALALDGLLNSVWTLLIFYFSVFSCLAEVAHYLCHVQLTPLPQFLRKTGLLISKQRHMQHHFQDNTQYTFLNGMTDPLVNWIAARLYPGYKTTTDLHYTAYAGPDTENRA